MFFKTQEEQEWQDDQEQDGQQVQQLHRVVPRVETAVEEDEDFYNVGV